MRPRFREVEYYRLWAGNSGKRGTWDTDFVKIPAETPDEQLDQAVQEAAAEMERSEEPPLIVGIYCDDEEEGDPESAEPSDSQGGS